MTAQKDYAIRELGRLELTLQHDLVFTPHRSGPDAYYVVEDPVNSKFHRIGLAEYTFISLLDGRTSINDVLAMTAKASPQHALSENEAASICKWLVESGLAHTTESSQANQLLAAARTRERSVAMQRWNPIVFRLPLFHPNRFFEKLLPALGWMHCRAAMAAGCLLALIAAYQVTASWDRFLVSSRGIFSPTNWLWLFVSWLALKFIHEISHGIVCKRYGGAVREAGVMLILFAPLAYVDVTDSWRFRSKWRRIQTAAAGMYCEILVAAVACLIWSATDEGTLNNVCYNVIVMASFMTVLVNANPLMRFDGYYICSDLLEIPNLYSSGQQYLSYWAKRYLLGVPATRPSWSRSHERLITMYGVAALCWRVMFCVGIIIAAMALFHGAGIVLAVLAAVLWGGLPAIKFAKYLFGGQSDDAPNLPRFLKTAGTMAVVAVLMLTVVPWPGLSRAPAVVEFAPLTTVRAYSSGFVRELVVQSGQQVEQGQIIAVLENDQLLSELVKLDVEIKQSQLKCRIFQQAQEMASYQAELKNLESLETKQREKARQVDQLTVRAPTSGQILGRNLASRLGSYLSEGEEIIAIGNEKQKEFRFSVAQEDHDTYRDYVGRAVNVRLKPGNWLQANLETLDPRAKLEPAHQALCATYGGPLPVKDRQAGSAEQEDGTSNRYELLAPRFSGSVKLSPLQSTSLNSGQLGTVTIRAFQESIGSHLYNLVVRWIRNRAGR